MSDESTAANADYPAEPDDGPEESDAAPLPTCPRCGDPVISVTTRGPTDHVAAPCGCRVGSPDL